MTGRERRGEQRDRLRSEAHIATGIAWSAFRCGSIQAVKVSFQTGGSDRIAKFKFETRPLMTSGDRASLFYNGFRATNASGKPAG